MAVSRRSPLAVIFLTVFLDLLGFGMVIPILPLYASDLHASNIKIGLLLSVYSMMQLFFSPIWGRVSDRAGRRPVLLVSILGSCGSQLGYALAPSFWWLVVARAFAGLCRANITAAQGYVADVTNERSRAAGMGMLGAALGLGFVCGPAAGGLLSQFSPRLPFLIASSLSGLNFVLAYFILQEPKPPSQRSHARTLTWAALVRTVSTPRLLALMLLFFIVTFGFANLEGTFSLYLKLRFDYDRREASYLFAYIGVIMIVVQGVLVRWLAPRVGERRLVVSGIFLMAVGFFLQYGAASLPVLLLSIGFTALGNGLNTPALSSLVSRAAGGDQQGGVLGVAQAAGALARVLGPIAGTAALDWGVGMPYLTGGATLLAAGLFAAIAVRQPEE